MNILISACFKVKYGTVFFIRDRLTHFKVIKLNISIVILQLYCKIKFLLLSLLLFYIVILLYNHRIFGLILLIRKNSGNPTGVCCIERVCGCVI